MKKKTPIKEYMRDDEDVICKDCSHDVKFHILMDDDGKEVKGKCLVISCDCFRFI